MATGPLLSDREVLLLFRRNIAGDFWKNRGWDASVNDLNSWFGVTATSDGRVVKLNLEIHHFRPEEDPRLVGSIPAELGKLSSLEHLELLHIRLTGSIPAELGTLSSLERLDVSGNRLTGSIPAELGTLSSLLDLDVSRNRLTGSIPAELGTLSSLLDLDVSRNQLIGSIPAELGELSTLERLDVTGNQLTGSIPAELGTLSSLLDLDVSNNRLTGSIPAELGTLISLESFNVSYNRLTGSIPAELGELSTLERLDVTGNQLTGSIPAELGTLSSLLDLHVSYNRLTGSIPAELGTLISLESFNVSYNRLTGSIPAELGELSSLLDLDVSRNQLTGSIPAELGKLSRLDRLHVSWNQLTGSIPAELGELSTLERLDVTGNQLTGSIPAELGKLSSLQTLIVRENQLTGSIPAELGKLSSLQTLIVRENQLTGSIPAELGKLSRLDSLHVSWNQLTGSIPAELGELSSLLDLDVSRNQLTGSIPAELGKLSRLDRLHVSWNQLTGSIPAELGELSTLERLDVSGNQLTGSIPAELGKLRFLSNLNVTKNQLTGPIPRELVNHEYFDAFETGLSLTDGPPLPAVRNRRHAAMILALPIILGYTDLASDLYTAASYHRSGRHWWGALGLTFAIGPSLIMAVFFVAHTGWVRRILVAIQLSLIFEALSTASTMEYSQMIALIRVVEPLFEAVPQLMLQSDAILVLWSETSPSSNRWRIVSLCISATSLAYAATDISSVEAIVLQNTKGAPREGDSEGASREGGWCSLCRYLSRLTGFLFSRVPETAEVGWSLKIHPRAHVWLCFVYHVLEIASRFIPLGLLALVMRSWFSLILVWLWLSRCLLQVRMIRRSTAKDNFVEKIRETTASFRFRVRVVAMPFLDSIIDNRTVFGYGLALTSVESVIFMVVYHVYPREHELAPNERLAITVAAVCCLAGKTALALAAIMPLKETGRGFEGALTDGSIA